MLYQVEELLQGDGASPFAEWFDSLEAVAAAKVRVAVGRMEHYKRRKACARKGD